jgi:uncharacterized membrane protein
MKISTRTIIIAVLAVAGIILSALALQLHYSVKASTFCNFSDTFNCDVVNKSWASQISGIPVALIGIIGYALILLGSIWVLLTKKLYLFTWGAIGLASLGGLGFSLFLTGVEIFNLHSFCIYCLGSQAVILTITILVWTSLEARQGFRSWFFSSPSS